MVHINLMLPIAVLGICATSLNAQTSEGVSKPIKIYINKTAGLPANLIIEQQLFEEPSGNGFLDAEETAAVVLKLANTGRGDAFNVAVKVAPESDVAGVSITTPPPTSLLSSGSKQTVRIPVSAAENVTSKQIKLKIEATEANGFDLDPPAYITFNTKSLVPPNLIIADVGINDQTGNGQIEPREIVELTVRIQNKSQGDARSVRASVRLGENVFTTPDSKTEFDLSTMQGGAFRDIVFSVYTNTKATSVPVSIAITEARGRFNKDIPLELAFNKPQKRATELIVEGKETAPGAIAEVASLSVDVDQKIPEGKGKNPDAVAVVIGISRYKNKDVPPVDYAKRGAAVMKEYVVKTLGYDERRIIYAEDENAALADFKKIFEEQLRNTIRPGKSDVFIYYQGHGAPDPETKQAFFVPYDCDPSYAKSTGYPVREFYERLSKLSARSVTVVLDACFSGSTPKGMLLKQVSPVFVSVEEPAMLLENGIVFASSTGQQLSNWYPEKKHGLFTYYFLKGLRGEADKDGDKQVTVGEMEEYLSSQVPDQARYLNNREQTPQVMGRDKQRVVVRY